MRVIFSALENCVVLSGCWVALEQYFIVFGADPCFDVDLLYSSRSEKSFIRAVVARDD